MLNSFDRNYGSVLNSREFWGGNNGFVTVIVKAPADTEFGATTVAQDGTDASQTALSAAERNLFRIVEKVAGRAVIVATSILSNAADPTVANFEDVGGNVLAFAKSGAVAAGSFAVTFLIERADVLNAQAVRPGSNYPVPVNPCKDIADELMVAGLFTKKDGTPSVAPAGVAVKVYDALPPIMA